MSTATSARTSSRTSTWVGIAVGLILLGLVAAFAIGLPKAADEESDPQPAPLALPAELPGGYAAADVAASFEGTDLESQGDAIAKSQTEVTTYSNKVLPDVLGRPAVARTYVAPDGQTPVYVEAFRAEGGALAPQTLLNPNASTAGGSTMTQIGDAACVLFYGQSQTGAAATDPSAVQCQISQDGTTVQIQGSGIDAQDLVEAADGLLDELAPQDQ